MSAVAVSRPKPRRALRGLGSLVLLAVGLWLAGLLWFALGLRPGAVDLETPVDAIVVLTGGSQRLEGGVRLLSEGKARKLFISGVHQGVESTELMRVAHVPPSLAACCVVLGHAADNTAGNALESALWLRREGYRTIRLVTANYHMRRALLEFSRVAPDLVVIANPVVPDGPRQAAWWAWRGPVYTVVVEYTKYLGAVTRAWLGPPPVLPAEPSA